MAIAKRTYRSWGRVPESTPANVSVPSWPDELPTVVRTAKTALAIGLQRSYGDSALNNGGTLLDMTALDRIHAFDPTTGVLRADAGAALGELYDLVVPHGWFLPVVPGTQFVTLGGAVANDIHGKNHHRHGSFGCHVRALGLLRSDGNGTVSPVESGEMFYATIGGLGLTGVITWVEVQCLRIITPSIDVFNKPVSSVVSAANVLEQHDSSHEFTVAWIDTVHASGRGVVHCGNWSESGPTHSERKQRGGIPIPLDAPDWLVGRWTVSLFNRLWYARHRLGAKIDVVPFRPFFHPLDMLHDWNRLYGQRGMVQYQFVVPTAAGVQPIDEVLGMVRRARLASFLTVLKSFGQQESGGMLSFPMPGLTLALDFPNTGRELFALLDQFDAVVRNAGGRVYPAKDCRLAGASFRAMYPQLERFQTFVDPFISSSFWRRTMQS